MRRSLLILSFFIATNVEAQDVRNLKWGWNQSQVKVAEKFKLIQQKQDQLSYEGSISGKKYLVLYTFINNQLVSAFMLFQEKYINKNNYIVEYEGLKERLTAKYPEVILDKIEWNNDLYKDRPDDIGMACSVGHVRFNSEFYSEDNLTQVFLNCKGENFDIGLSIYYISTKHRKLIQAKNAAETKDDF